MPKKSTKKYFSPLIFHLSFRRGFTLVELLVVIALIGFLVAVALSRLDPLGQFKKAQDSKRKSDLSQVSKAIEQYYEDHKRYPQASADFKIMDIDPADSTLKAIEWGSTWPPSYMDVIPKDPKTGKSYVYYSDSSGQSYWLYASLDRAGDVQVCNGGSKCLNAPASATCGATCNYGVSSPNTSP